MKISDETIVILDALAALGNVIEIIDTDGVYYYCSDNSNFANIAPKDMIGQNMKDIYGLTDESSKVMQVIRTGIPKRDIDALQNYWDVLPSIRASLFEKEIPSFSTTNLRVVFSSLSSQQIPSA